MSTLHMEGQQHGVPITLLCKWGSDTWPPLVGDQFRQEEIQQTAGNESQCILSDHVVSITPFKGYPSMTIKHENKLSLTRKSFYCRQVIKYEQTGDNGFPRMKVFSLGTEASCFFNLETFSLKRAFCAIKVCSWPSGVATNGKSRCCGLWSLIYNLTCKVRIINLPKITHKIVHFWNQPTTLPVHRQFWVWNGRKVLSYVKSLSYIWMEGYLITYCAQNDRRNDRKILYLPVFIKVNLSQW